MKKNDYQKYLANILPCIYFGILCGSVTGGVIFLFKLAAKYLEELSRHLYGIAKDSPLYILIGFAVLIAAALAMAFLHKLVPEAKGGGIPRSEGILRGLLPLDRVKTFIGTFFGSMISFFAGLPLGSEGPAVLIGTSLGGMFGRLSKNPSAWDRYVMTGGAGAGFAVATGAPLSGILFALEEIHKRFTPMLVLTVSMSVVSATFVNRLLCTLCGISPELFSPEAFWPLELSHVGYLLLLGILTALIVAIFDASLFVFSKLSAKIGKRYPATAKILTVFLITGIMGFFFADGIYSGHHLIHDILTHNKSGLILLALLIVRLFMMLLVTDSGVTGGIFIPTLAIGALTASLTAKLLVILGMPSELSPMIVMLGMCAFIGGTLRAPLTAVILFVELTGQFTNLFYVTLVVFTVNAITELFHQTPFYDRALENLVDAQNKGKEPTIACFEMKISDNSFVVGKAIRDIMWPPSTVVISITRADSDHADMDNDGEKKLYAGDTIVLRSRFIDEDGIQKLLYGLVGTDHEITKVDLT